MQIFRPIIAVFVRDEGEFFTSTDFKLVLSKTPHFEFEISTNNWIVFESLKNISHFGEFRKSENVHQEGFYRTAN